MKDNLDIEYSTNSMVDDFGRVFFFNEKVYRAISPLHESSCNELLNSTLFKELIERGYVPNTTVSTFKVEGCNLVLEHEKLVEIHQHEWSFDMLKDAALMVWDFNSLCNTHGYELKDAHNLNICFRGTTPVYVDIGSIAHKRKGSWIAYNEYLFSLVMPLLFWSKGYIYISRKLMESNFYRMFTIPSQGFEESGLLKLLETRNNEWEFTLLGKRIFSTQKQHKFISLGVNIGRKLFFKNRKSSVDYTICQKSLYDLYPINAIRNILEGTKRPKQNSEWDSYHTHYYIENGKVKYSSRFERIADLIKQVPEIKTVLDLAGNEGLFSRLLAERLNLERIILTDYDENALNAAYIKFKHLNNKNVHTALLNFMFTPSLKETALRFNSDLVIALAVTHHLLLTGKFSLGAIFDRLKLYSKKYVMVEFMPLGLWALGSNIYPEVPSYYTVNWFRDEFKKNFILIAEEQLEENRVLFFGFKK